MNRALAAAAALAGLVLLGAVAGAYPLDAWEETQIHRLEAYRLAREGLERSGRLPPGAFHSADEIRLALLDRPELALPAPDPDFSAQLRALLGADAGRYGVAILDLSDPARPRYAEHNGRMQQNPGSVGKIMVALAWFQKLADLHPGDFAARRQILRDTTVTANAFIQSDEHVVPLWTPGAPRVEKRPIREGDAANLWTFFDWMASASSNAAASMLMSHLVLIGNFGMDYPVSEEAAAAFFAETRKTELQSIFLDAILKPLSRNGLDPQQLRQGSFFTREGKRRVPGTNSLATARELVHFLLRLEQGKLVDPWSSLEMKRLLYLTDRRIRYASHPALADSSVYFKSGSLYSCKPEPGFACEKYHGNVRNYMNSVVIVETRTGGRSLHYAVAVLSNVLRKNSAVEHQTLAMRIHRLIESMHPVSAPGPMDATQASGPAPDAATTLSDR